MSKTRVIMIGIDGGTWDLFEPWAKEGKMPNLKKLMDNGAWAEMESTMPFVTGPAWPSMFTGKNPGKHGIFDFVRYEDGHLKVCKSSDVKAERIYDILSEKDLRSMIIGLPLSYPPKKSFNGIMLSDFLYPGKEIFPKEKVEYLNKYTQLADPFKSKKMQSKEIPKTAEKRVNFAKELFLKEDWDFFFHYFKETDTIFHRFWYDMGKRNIYGKAVRKTINILDDFLGWVIENMDENSILVLASDHGFGEYNYRIHLNTILKEIGFLKEKEKGDEISKKATDITGKQKKKIKIPYAIIRIGRHPLIRPLAEFVAKDLLNIRIEDIGTVDYINSKAFVPTEESLAIYCNDNLCSPEEREYLRKYLENLRYKGKEVFSRVEYREKVYTGNLVNKAPHLLLFLNDFMPSPALGKKDIIPFKYSWHKRNGIFLAYGYQIKPMKKMKKISIYDIAPTVLHLYGVDIPSDVDGRVLKEMFEKNSEFFERPINYMQQESKEELKFKIKTLKERGVI